MSPPGGWFQDFPHHPDPRSERPPPAAHCLIPTEADPRAHNAWVAAEADVGASATLAKEAVTVAGDLSQGEFDEGTAKAMRRMMPLQNLFYLRRLFDAAAEGGVGG